MPKTPSFDEWYNALCRALLREGQVFTPVHGIRNEVVTVDDRRIVLRSEAPQSVRAGTVRSFSRRRLKDFFERRTSFIDSLEPALDELARAELARRRRLPRRTRTVFAEGAPRQVVMTRAERSAAARRAALERYGPRCQVCGFEFDEFYGYAVSQCYFEVHHARPLRLTPEGTLTRVDELVVVCANCHRMIHRRRTPRDWRQLKAIVEARRAKRR